MRLTFMMKYMGCKHLQFLPIVALTLLIINSCGDMVADEDNPEELLQQYGHEYEVWADSGYGGPPANCLDPGASPPYTKLPGTGYNTQFFASGASTFYVILTQPGNFAFVDSAQDTSSFYWASAGGACNVNEDNAVNGLPPDDDFAWVGTEHSRGERGALIISGPSATGITIFISEHAYYWDD